MEIRYIIKLEILAAGSPYNNSIQVSIFEGKIVIFRITSGARLTPDITIPSVHRKNTNLLRIYTLLHIIKSRVVTLGWQNTIDYLISLTGVELGAANLHLSK